MLTRRKKLEEIDGVLHRNTLSLELNVLETFSDLIKFRVRIRADIKEDSEDCQSLVLGNCITEARKELAIPVDKMQLSSRENMKREDE